jgi:hypothetical protein
VSTAKEEIDEDDLDEINKIIDEEPMPLMTDGDQD